MKIVRIRKLDDIADKDWEITLENEGKIYHNHKHFFEIVERGIVNESPKPIEKPKDVQTNEAIFFPTEEEQFEETRKKEKEEVAEFRKDVKELSYYQFNKKYVNRGDTKKWYMHKNSSTLASFELKLTTEGLIILEKKIAPANEFTEAMNKWNPSYENTPVIESMIKYSDEVFTVMLQDIQKMTY